MWHNIETNPPKSGMYYVVRVDCNGENIYTRRMWCDGSWQRWNDFVEDWEYIEATDEGIVAWSDELVPYGKKNPMNLLHRIFRRA